MHPLLPLLRGTAGSAQRIAVPLPIRLRIRLQGDAALPETAITSASVRSIRPRPFRIHSHSDHSAGRHHCSAHRGPGILLPQRQLLLPAQGLVPSANIPQHRNYFFQFLFQSKNVATVSGTLGVEVAIFFLFFTGGRHSISIGSQVRTTTIRFVQR